ncbi:GNAT family N-acetyltransferase [Streptomyces tagetis]|uniref:GNAT family N-acetyltransferase n=1 Tax=Streptomyces tagetis TaxID=2820809 RepID=A0A940XQN5_9ACTN|nr:GNAT family N-acetyltransferase [Streptomyces sp. RG38]MBQ0830586.1 GNAT family N-acetyltransferase [Streptomyces sp. RG38]
MTEVADVVTHAVEYGPGVPVMLVASVLALLATAACSARRARRPRTDRPTGVPGPADVTGAGTGTGDGSGPLSRLRKTDATAGATSATAPTAPTADTRTRTRTGHGNGVRDGDGALWRMRTTVRDTPGSLAALCTALADRGVDILSLQTHPLAEGTVDEFLLRAPGALTGDGLARVASAAGGTDTWTERADAHDLVDTPARVLGLAARTALDSAELPLALRQLLGRCGIRTRPAPVSGEADVPEEGVFEETVLRLRAPDGGVISVERPHPPFTPAEFARARALVALDARLGSRAPADREATALPRAGVTLGGAGAQDLDAAQAMHRRCSARTLGTRYHGPAEEADRYLRHLLGPHHGRTVAARTGSGRIVALGHLLWDGDETEVALLVEDAWQRRGIGTALLARLVEMAVEAGCASVYAVTRASNTGMVAAMRGLGLPLDYRIEEGTLVLTARLDAVPAAPRLPHGERVGRD